jgi:hypothetical protein
MTDFATTDLISPVLAGDAMTGRTTDLLWWFEAPPIPPTPPTALPAIKCEQAVQVIVGRDELAGFLGAILTDGYVKSFKLGEGAWSASAITVEQINVGNGGAVYSDTTPAPANASTISRLPLVPGTVSISAGVGHNASDLFSDGGLYDATGSLIGTVNYKTGEWSLTYLTPVPGGTAIDARYSSRGKEEIKGEDLAPGAGSAGPFNGTLTCFPLVPGMLTITDADVQVVTDNGDGTLGGDGTGTIDYETGVYAVTFTDPVALLFFVRATYHAYLIPTVPQESRTELVSESATGLEQGLYTFSKDLSPGDFVFQGVGTGAVRVTLTVDAAEGNDDGSGNPPFYFEGGLFSNNGVLIMYFTMSGVKKTASGALTKIFDLVM